MRPIDIKDVVNLLCERIESLCHEILPNGVREFDEWRVGSTAGEPGRSLMIRLTGPRRGVWVDFHFWDASRQSIVDDHAHGDPLDLIAEVLFGGEKGPAFRWATQWLNMAVRNPAEIEASRKRAARRSEETEVQKDKRRRQAFAIWQSAKPDIFGTPVETYLQGRAINLRSLLPQRVNAIRYEPRLYCSEIKDYLPGMVAAVTGPGKNGRQQIVAVHRTYLKVHDDGHVTKADLQEPKKTIGGFGGGAIHLWRGVTRKPWTDLMPGEWCIVSEGIEDGLSAVFVRPEFRCVCAVSVGNAAAIVWPANVGGLILLAQNDAPSSQAAGILSRIVTAWQGQGKAVKLARPPEGVKDANDLLRQA